MSRTYSDYYTKTALTIPESFIDVKTGNTIRVKEKIREEVEYHTKNSTLIHLVLSALHDYFYTNTSQISDGGTKEILFQLAELKRLIERNGRGNSSMSISSPPNRKENNVQLKEIEELLEAFGG